MRRLFGPSQAPNTAASTVTTTVVSAPAEDDDFPITPRPNIDGSPGDQQRLADLEGDLAKYKGLFNCNDINTYVVSQQASNDAALVASRMQVDQLLQSLASVAAASLGQTIVASSDQPAVASSDQLAASSGHFAADVTVNSDRSASFLAAGSIQRDCSATNDYCNFEEGSRAEVSSGFAIDVPSLDGRTALFSEQGDSAMLMARGMRSSSDALLL